MTINTKFRKKPVVIEAFQMTKRHWTDWTLWPEWLVTAAQGKAHDEPGAMYSMPDGERRINTLEGFHVVSLGDWIIQGVKGELYPCKPDVFEQTYEAA